MSRNTNTHFFRMSNALRFHVLSPARLLALSVISQAADDLARPKLADLAPFDFEYWADKADVPVHWIEELLNQKEVA